METDLEAKRSENLLAIQNFTLMDDTFMTKVFSGNIRATEYLLGIALQREDLKVIRAVTQMPIANLFGRSVRLDIYARDSENRQYDIEVQQRNDGAVPERARLNSSLFDAMLTEQGNRYTDIPETYVIFITENDVLGYGLPSYNIERTIRQNQQLFDDKEHIIYINGAYRGNDPIGSLMADFHCADYRKIGSRILAEAVRYYKEDPEGVNEMCDAMDKISEKRAEEALAETALRMIKAGFAAEQIAELTGLSLAKVKELADKRSA